jgi:hypothetical protein
MVRSRNDFIILILSIEVAMDGITIDGGDEGVLQKYSYFMRQQKGLRVWGCAMRFKNHLLRGVQNQLALCLSDRSNASSPTFSNEADFKNEERSTAIFKIS